MFFSSSPSLSLSTFTRGMPASGEYRASRDISSRYYQRACIEEAEVRDYAAARPGEHNCREYGRGCARTATRETALAPARLLLYNNYRLIKICYLTLR